MGTLKGSYYLDNPEPADPIIKVPFNEPFSNIRLVYKEFLRVLIKEKDFIEWS